MMNFVEWWDTFGRARWQAEDARDHKTAAELAWNAARAQRAEVRYAESLTATLAGLRGRNVHQRDRPLKTRH